MSPRKVIFAVGAAAVVIVVLAIAVLLVGAVEESVDRNTPPSAEEVYTLYFVDAQTKAEKQPFMIWCPSTGYFPLGNQSP